MTTTRLDGVSQEAIAAGTEMSAGCGCGYEFDGNVEGAGEHNCPADCHAEGCGCSDAYDTCLDT